MEKGKAAKQKEDFDWETHPDLDKFINERVEAFLFNHKFSKKLSERMLEETSTRFVDWIDHVSIPESEVKASKLTNLGLVEMPGVQARPGVKVFKHPRSYLFPVLLNEGKETLVALKPESIDEFLQVLGTGIVPEGEPFSAIRWATIQKEGNFTLAAVERRGYDGFVEQDASDVQVYLDILTKLYCRKRFFNTDKEGMQYTVKLIGDSVKRLRSARVADAFFRAERAYWQKRNRAGQVQKARQDRLGLGWGNHDHHTYRSSRDHFVDMIKIFEALGYSCREKYYAGEKAGWGAQILEHKVCNIVIFTDVDLAPEETSIDFSHKGLPDRKELGTVGLWVGLHGESILQAGMHHLEARFMFDKLKADLEQQGVAVMTPFSYFDFLKQAFTQGDTWKVDKTRLDRLIARGSINKEQYGKFLKEGAIGSHMENLERDQGFKGFNKASVTKIISETDPRKQYASGA